MCRDGQIVPSEWILEGWSLVGREQGGSNMLEDVGKIAKRIGGHEGSNCVLLIRYTIVSVVGGVGGVGVGFVVMLMVMMVLLLWAKWLWLCKDEGLWVCIWEIRVRLDKLELGVLGLGVIGVVTALATC